LQNSGFGRCFCLLVLRLLAATAHMYLTGSGPCWFPQLKHVMFSLSFHRLLREWVALFAVLAMVLGPLALATSRSLAAQERVQLAAGLTALPMCTPGDSIDGLNAKTGGGACDHCSSAAPALVPLPANSAVVALFSACVAPANTAPSALLAQLRLPPATGPPAL
jgi:hypothetical protein